MRHHHHRQQPTPPHRHHRQTQTDQVLSGGNTIPDSKSKSIQNPTRWNYKVSQKSTFLKAKRPQCMIVSSMSLTQQIYNHTGCIRHYQHHQQHWHHHHPRRFAVKKYSYTSIITLCSNLLSSQLSFSSSPSSDHHIMECKGHLSLDNSSSFSLNLFHYCPHPPLQDKIFPVLGWLHKVRRNICPRPAPLNSWPLTSQNNCLGGFPITHCFPSWCCVWSYRFMF